MGFQAPSLRVRRHEHEGWEQGISILHFLGGIHIGRAVPSDFAQTS
jgi:hypothetical protein